MIFYGILEFFKERKNEDVNNIIQKECFYLMEKLNNTFHGKRRESVQLSFCYIMSEMIFRDCRKGMEDRAINLLAETIKSRVIELNKESLKNAANE